jgi:hypothetical protein
VGNHRANEYFIGFREEAIRQTISEPFEIPADQDIHNPADMLLIVPVKAHGAHDLDQAGIRFPR